MTRLGESETVVLGTIHQAAASGDLPNAMSLAEKALADGLQHPLVLNLAAAAREQAGEFDQALVLLRQAVAMSPGDTGSHVALGLCLQRMDGLPEALECFDTVVRLAPESPFGHVNRGRVLQISGRFAEAVASYDRCLSVSPQHPIALAGKARIASFLGAFDEARRLGESAVALAPGWPDAVLAAATAQMSQGELVAAERRLCEFLARGQLDPADEADVRGLLGDVLDAARRETEAFASYASCNGILQGVHHRVFGQGRRAIPYLRSMLEVLEQASPVYCNDGDAGRHRSPPVFLIGFPRSGTTLLEVTLDGHPEVTSLEEHELMLGAARAFMNAPGDLRRLLTDPDLDLEAFRGDYWRAAQTAGADLERRIFIDKYPLNALKLPLIARLFPGAKIVFAIRDPRDVVFSCFRRRFRMSAPMYEMLTLQGAAEYYGLVMSFAQQCCRVFGLQPYFVRYESLLEDFEGEMLRLCHYLDLEWTAAMGDFAARAKGRATATPSTAQLSSGLDKAGAGHWRRYAPQLQEVLPQLQPWTQHFGYAMGHPDAPAAVHEAQRPSFFARMRGVFGKPGN